jgi:propanol-preferring alcohol dehydrogenase
MKALVLEGIKELAIRDVPDPELSPGGAIIEVQANGVCRSDWHAWVGDNIRKYPVILGHEMTGVVTKVAEGVKNWKRGDRVVVPFSGSDGTCEYCRSGRSHLCDSFLVPGYTYAGGYAQYVNVPLADRNLVRLPESVSFRDGAALGCRFMTSFHGLVDRVAVQPGEWVVVYGCGGVGLSAINIAVALGATVIGVDINPANLALAKTMGAAFVIDASATDPVEATLQITNGGAHVSVDALGRAETCVNSIKSLRKAGRQLQVGVTTKKEGGQIAVPIDLMVFKELQITATIGMPAHRYDAMVPLVAAGRLVPGKMVTGEISLAQVSDIMEQMSASTNVGTYVVTKFDS